MKLSIKFFFSNEVLLNIFLIFHSQTLPGKPQERWSFFLHLCNQFQISLQSCRSCCQNKDPMLPQKRKLLHIKPKIDCLNWKCSYNWTLILHLILMIFILFLKVNPIFLQCLNFPKLNFFITSKVHADVFPSNKFYQSIRQSLLIKEP